MRVPVQRPYAPLPSDIPTRGRMFRPRYAAFRETENRTLDVLPIRFDFGGDPAQSLNASEKASFCADFRWEFTSLRSWLTRTKGWTTPAIPELRVFVSDAYKISRALVPAWDGHLGWMEFPARRAAAGKSAILHELTHVYLPNGNRFLAEGLATYLQALLGGNPAFPNFGRPLHNVARDCLLEITSAETDARMSVELAELDAIPTPNPLTLTAARLRYEREAAFQTAIYAIAGSFVEFLIETQGLPRFLRLYCLTPLKPGRLTAGVPDRWFNIYGSSLRELEAGWKSRIVAASS